MTYPEYEEKRNLLGLTNGQVAKYSGVSTATLSQWKKGAYEPKLQTLAKIKKLLDNYDPNHAVDYLIKDDNSELTFIECMQAPKIYTMDSINVAFQKPIKLTESEYTELKRTTEVFVSAWLMANKKLKG